MSSLAVEESQFSRYFGVVLDGFRIGFVRYHEKWVEDGPYPVNENTVMKLLEAIRGLQRKPLRAEILARDLGPGSPLSQSFVKALYSKLSKTNSKRVDMLFQDWKRVFQQVCGYTPEKLKGLEKTYDIPGKKIDHEALLFSIHTYYALVMKLIAAEVAALSGESYFQSYIEKLRASHLRGSEALREEFEDLEEGGIFKKIGIRNFLEGDYFSWYLDVWDKEFAGSMSSLAETLGQYEPGTVELEPENIKDMLKNLYQFLVPKHIRRKLGEYYTPDWLAEYLLNEVSFEGDPQRRVLDPACGSGTFLVQAIKRVRMYANQKFLGDAETVNSILNNVVGFDLNPLAVIAARTNYLLALGSLRRYRPAEMEIPVYLADSILIERRADPFGKILYVLRTSVHRFEIPAQLVESNNLSFAMTTLDELLTMRGTPKDYGRKLQKQIELDEVSLGACIELFEVFEKLEKQKKDRIWSKIIKNSFAPLFARRFDFVVGNPPWIRWDNLPESYREVTEEVWDKYGLLKQTKGAGMGKIKKDMAMLFVAVGIDRYLADDGTLGFLIPFTILKNQAGAGFRAHLQNHSQVLRIHDMVELMPFEDTINRTALILLKKGRTRFPIPVKSWKKLQSGSMFREPLDEVLKKIKDYDMVMEPIEGNNKPESSWMMAKSEAFTAIRKGVLPTSTYEASAGVFTGLNGVYWVDIISEDRNTVMIKNRADAGRNELIKGKELPVEKEFLYPLLRGQDVKKWSANPSGTIILPIKDGEVIRAPNMRVDYPKCYFFFDTFFDALINRNAEPFKSKLEPYRKKGKVDESAVPPFYWLFNVGDSLASFKVVWKEISGKISGKGQLVVSVVRPHTLSGHSAPIVPDHKLMFIPFKKEEEAYYVAGVLNSSLVRLIVASYTIETGVDTHIVKHIRLPEFDSSSKLHKDIASISKKAHAAANNPDKLGKIEEELEQKVKELFELTDDELAQVKESLSLVGPSNEEVEEEEEETEEDEEESS